MTDGSGPGMPFIILLVVLGIFVIASAGFVVTRRRARTPDVVVEEEAPSTPEVVEEAAEAPVVEDASIIETPVVEEPLVETPAVQAPPVEAPAVQAPPVEEPPVVPTRGRVRSIGSSLKRLFRGTTLSAEDWEELEEILLRADVGVVATQRIVSDLRARKDITDGFAALRAELLDVLGTFDRELKRRANGVTTWLITGVNGVGKTTTIGKLAARLRDEGSSVVLAAADTFRAAADEQLQRWADAAGAEMVRHAPGADPAAVVFDGVAAARARSADVLIVDTAGRLQTKRTLMEELSKINRVLEREGGPSEEVLLVLDATTGQNGLQQARAFAEAAPVSGVVLTKLDGSAKGGIVIAVQQELGIPVKLVGLGEGIKDLAQFEPEKFVDELLDQGADE